MPLRYYTLFDLVLPSYMLMFIAFLAGVIFTGLMGLAERLNMTRTIRQLNKTVRDLRREMRAQEPFVKENDKKEADDSIKK